MSANSFGHILKATTFGESHGPAMGAVIEGCPAGVEFDHGRLLAQLARRRPGQSDVVTARRETDSPQILSGVFEGWTLGTPIAIVIPNQDAKSAAYAGLKPRPGHADDTWKNKFGHADPRGGGRASGRETVARLLAGAVAEMILAKLAPVSIVAFARQIGPWKLPPADYGFLTRADVDTNAARLPNLEVGLKAIEGLKAAKVEGRSYGGVIEVMARGLPTGLGQPVFHKLKSDLAAAMMSVGATAGVEFGDGFAVADKEGSSYHSVGPGGYGGQRGGISTGEPVIVRVAFKPTASVMDVAKKGRHDPCIVPRAVPVLEAMMAWVLADHVLWQRLDRV